MESVLTGIGLGFGFAIGGGLYAFVSSFVLGCVLEIRRKRHEKVRPDPRCNGYAGPR
jgi:hypothetical protein